tara:strand:+ start:3248 stop:3454 length:207 start_codon:yes stop_codon:yes gene_type:complete
MPPPTLVEEVIIKTELKGMITCRNRFFRLCDKECTRDYESHHPNNYDCSRHIPITIWGYEVVESKNTS